MAPAAETRPRTARDGNASLTKVGLPASLRRVLLIVFGLIVPIIGFAGGSHAAPLPQAYFNQAGPQPDVPSDALIGEDFTFQVRFKNAPGASMGYGPFIDLAIDFGGNDDNAPPPVLGGPCDGIDIVSVQMVGVNGGPVPLPIGSVPSPTQKYGNTNAASCPATSASHPYPLVGAISFPAGYQLVTIALPFGSFDASQPEVVLKVTAHMHKYADLNIPLKICPRGGFRFGANPTNGPPVLQTGTTTNQVGAGTWTCQPVTPRLFTLTKKYSGPEDETATGPNFVHSYKITLDVATGQTISSTSNPLTIKDCMPNGMIYRGGLAAPGWVPTPVLPIGTSGGCLTLSWPAALVGVAGPDKTIQFDFSTADVANCNPVTLPNSLSASGFWTPTDPRDPPGPFTFTDASAHKLAAKCLAIQKTLLTAPPYIPGQVLQYRLDFQVSDYKTIGKILKIVDFLSNGQAFLTGGTYTPRLTFQDRTGNHPNIPLSPAYYTTTPSNVVAGTGCPKGSTALAFDVSGAMSTFGTPVRQTAGILTGGYAASPSSPIPATGSIVFYAKITDSYVNPPLPNGNVDKYDPVCNAVAITGDVYKNNPNPAVVPPLASPPQSATDGSGTKITIAAGVLTKTVYAIRRGGVLVCGPTGTACASLPQPPQVFPGDNVTFRIQYVIPSGDAQSLVITDWLPRPIFNVPPILGGVGICPAITLANTVCRLLPGNSPALPVPIAVPNPSQNSFDLHYAPPAAPIVNPANTPRAIDLLATFTVTNIPFADGLNLTNETRECEQDTIDVGVNFCQVAIAQVNVREPSLNIRKGVIATDNLNGVFTQPGAAGLAQAPAGANFSLAGVLGAVTSATIGNLFNSDLSNVDANDYATFAVVIENTGGYTAYNVHLDDFIPWDKFGVGATCFTLDQSTIKVRDGAGTPLTPLMGSTASNFGVTFASIPAQNATGSNIIIITFKVRMLAHLKAGCCENTADLTQYASDPGGPSPTAPNFVTAGFGGPFHDTARICSGPRASMKCIQATSEAHTTPQTAAMNGQVPATLGEIVRFQLVTTVPEGTTQGLQIQDLLPAGLTYIPGTAKAVFIANSTVTNAAGIPTDTTPGLVPQCPGTADPMMTSVTALTPAFPATPVMVTNSDNDPGLEYLVIELNAQVGNVTTNQDSVVLSDRFQANFTDAFSGQPASSTSGQVGVKIVEPKLVLHKVASPTTLASTAGGLVTYTATITNSGTAAAFDIAFTDTLPVGFVSPTLISPPLPAGCTSAISGQTLSVNCPSPGYSLPVNGTLTIAYTADVNSKGCAGSRENKAAVTWTSLPGPNGTVLNPTGSATAGASGAADGERNGVTAPLTLNDYSAADTAVVSCGPAPGTLTIQKVVVNPQNLPLPSSLTTPGYPNGFPIWLMCSTTPNTWIPVYLATSTTTSTTSPPSAPQQCTVVETTASFTNPIPQPPVSPLPLVSAPQCGSPVKPNFAGWTTSYSTNTSANSATATIPAGGTATITVTNTLDCVAAVNLEVKKLVVNNTSGTLPANLTTGGYPNGFPIWFMCSGYPYQGWYPVYMATSTAQVAHEYPYAGSQCTVMETNILPPSSVPLTTPPPSVPLPPVPMPPPICPSGYAEWTTTYSTSASSNSNTIIVPNNNNGTMTVTNTLNCH